MNPIDEKPKARQLKFTYYLLLFIAAIIVLLGIKVLVIPFILSIILYYSLNPIVDSMESNGIPRSLGIFIVFFVLLGVGYWVLNFYLSPALDKLSPFLNYWAKELQKTDSTALQEQVQDLIPLDSSLVTKIFPADVIAKKSIDYARVSLKSFIDFLPDIVGIFIITPILCYFMLLDSRKIFKFFISIVPNRYFELVLMITHNINIQLSSYLKGLLIQSSVIILVASLGFYLLNLNFFILFAFFLGITNIIPYIGPALGLIPPSLYVLLQDGNLLSIIPVFIVVLICQLIDNLILQPTVIAKSASLHPVLILIGLAAGGYLLGIWGMIITIPLLSILKVTISVIYTHLRNYGVIE